MIFRRRMSVSEDINIDWPDLNGTEILLSNKDKELPTFAEYCTGLK